MACKFRNEENDVILFSAQAFPLGMPMGLLD